MAAARAAALAAQVPCAWEDGVGCVGVNYGGLADDIAAGTTVSTDGVIAVFWADLTAGEQRRGEGVYYQVVEPEAAQAHMLAWNKLIVEWQLPVWAEAGVSAEACHFEVRRGGGGGDRTSAPRARAACNEPRPTALRPGLSDVHAPCEEPGGARWCCSATGRC
jgi:hypothetical protein